MTQSIDLKPKYLPFALCDECCKKWSGIHIDQQAVKEALDKFYEGHSFSSVGALSWDKEDEIYATVIKCLEARLND